MKTEPTIRELINAKGFEDRARPAGSHHGREIVHVGTGISLGVWSAQQAVESIIHGSQAVS